MRPPTAPRGPRRTPGPLPEERRDEPDRTPAEQTTPGQLAAPVEPAATPPSAGRGRWLPVGPSRAQTAADPGFVERLAERTRARRRLAWRKVLVVVAALAVLGGAAWAVLVSPLFALDMEDVTVSGVGEGTTVPRDEVVALVEERVGTPLPRLDTGALTEQLTAITTVRSAQVSRSWPNGLAVDVVARVPVAAATSEDGLVLLDVDGVVVGSVPEAPEGLPRVTVPLSGERAGETLAAVLTVLAELPADLRAQVATAGASNPASITLELTDGAEVRWGAVEESALKASVLAVLREREARVYDLTVPRAPTISH
ncbi:cell division protein FtsQ/DivIB [Georgenia sp. H159]|uniref:cell division protein FtsQ/DivIB n=1 Tax=Georgenia sp. H159 TaxID=3076115 RepID=UPI002D7A1474|nr:cell division protein FtsQ/DivIB [Georgenia sp. H159]